MTPRACKIALRKHQLILNPGRPPVPSYLSDFKKRRYRKAFRLVHLYLRKGYSSPEISRILGRTHQRVCQILELGIDYMLETGHIHPAKNDKSRAA